MREKGGGKRVAGQGRCPVFPSALNTVALWEDEGILGCAIGKLLAGEVQQAIRAVKGGIGGGAGIGILLEETVK